MSNKELQCPKFMLVGGIGMCNIKLKERAASDRCDFEGCEYVDVLKEDHQQVTGIRKKTVHLNKRPILVFEAPRK